MGEYIVKFSICNILIIMLLNTAFVYPGPDDMQNKGDSSDAAAAFDGKIISVGDDYIELKNGDREIVLYLTENTRYAQGENELTLKSIAICQSAKAEYISNNEKNELVKLEIIDESYCTE